MIRARLARWWAQLRRRLDRWAERIRTELRRAFADEYSSVEVSRSFALGVFITMLPTLGTGVLLFFLIAWLFERVSKIALFASVLVFNPAVKWGVYGASFTLGTVLLGPVEGATPTAPTLSAANDVVIRLVVGNVILAVVAAVPSYFVCHRVVKAFRAADLAIVESVEGIVEGDEDAAEE
ncbi:DUF2062 domain-containing protein [Haloparvum sedimenti]|uniref:DUF2062 domain-containing protein n=1 Tax=Haloparvum sedimenti TaxID=1678448 RepID=UPI00071E7575|nr:DUF2062 domain-containing protein [Haloparvum sedimenti]